MNMKIIFITGLCLIMLINPVFGYIAPVINNPDFAGFEFTSVSEPMGVEGGTAEVIIKGIRCGSGGIRFTLSTDEIAWYEWTYPNAKGVIETDEKVVGEYELRANVRFVENEVIDEEHQFKRIVCSASNDGHGSDSSIIFYGYAADNDAPKNNIPFLNPFTIFGIILVVVNLLNRQKGDTK